MCKCEVADRNKSKKDGYLDFMSLVHQIASTPFLINLRPSPVTFHSHEGVPVRGMFMLMLFFITVLRYSLDIGFILSALRA